jgi:hypothetical protein
VERQEHRPKVEGKVFWVQYYRAGKCYRESSHSTKESEAKNLLKKREGAIVENQFFGLKAQKVRYEELAEDFLNDYKVNKKKSLERAEMSLKHLKGYFEGTKAIDISTDRIRAYILKFLIDNWSLVKIGTTQAQKKLFYKIGKVRKALESNQENEKIYELLAKDLHVPKGDIVEMEQRMSSRDLSLDSTFDEDHELTHLDLLQDNSPDQEELVTRKEERRLGNKRLVMQ